MDETDTLREGEVFVTYDTPSYQQRVLVQDGIIVTRSPALHPGDIRVANAVDVPPDSPLRALANCIVFSQRGQRDLPSQLSGGDLDGDLYNVSISKPEFIELGLVMGVGKFLTSEPLLTHLQYKFTL